MIVYSYHDVLHQSRRIHSVPLEPGSSGKKLPLYKPVPWIAFVYLAIVELVFVILARTPIGALVIEFTKPLPYYLLLAPAAVWALMNVDLDGRKPHRWLYSYALFLARPKRTMPGRSLAMSGVKHTARGRISFRWDINAPRLHHGWVRGGAITTNVPVRFAYAILHRRRVMTSSDRHQSVVDYEVDGKLQVRP